MKKIYSLLLLAVALACLPMGVQGEELVVANDTWQKDQLPIDSYNCDSEQHNQFIYPASELASINGATISGIKFHTVKASYSWSTKGSPVFTIKVAEVEETTLSGFNTTASFTTIYEGKAVFANNVWDITFDTPYAYKGGNLLFDFSSPAAGYISTVKFYSAEFVNAGCAKGTGQSYIPKATLTYELAVTGPGLKVLDGSTKISTGYNYSFGLATAGTTKTFTLNNPGTEATPVAVSHTGSFGAELSVASIPAGGEVTLTVTMPATTGEDVITISSTAEGIDDFVINVSGTVREASKMWCNFSEGLPEGWTNSSYTINTTGAGAGTSDGGYAGNTNYSDYRLSTPKVAFAENEKMFLLVSGHGSTASWNSMKVQYSADGTNWTDAKSVTNIANGSWTSVEVTEIPAGTYYIGFYGRYYYLTDIYGGTLIAMPKNVAAAGVTDTEATISWEAAGSETAWQVSYSTTSGDPNKGTIVDATSTSKVLEGLSATTTYYVSVRIGDSGEWSDEISFTTACGATIAPYTWTFEGETADAIASCWDNSGSTSTNDASTYYYVWGVYNYNSNKSIRMCNYNVKPSTGSIALINSPRIVIPASPAYELAFDYAHNSNAGDLTVKISKDNGANWTNLDSYSKGAGSDYINPGAFSEAIIDLSEYAGETVTLQFYAPANYGNGAIFVDNVAVRVKSSCPAPKNPTVSAITTNTASVAWTEKGEATAWKLQTSTDGENWGDEIAADANPFTLNGLTAETTYYVRVKAICGESESSEWSDASEAFTTKCEAKAIGWSENFDDLSALPSCWESSSYGSGNGQWYAYSNSMRFNARVSSGTSADLVTPLVTLSDASVLTFKHEGTSVDVSVYANTGEGEVLLQTIPKSTATESINLSAYTGQTVSFTFRAYGYSTYSTAYFYLDDVAVNYLLVAAPTNVAATPANASAVVTWDSEESPCALRYREKDAEPEAEWTILSDLAENTKTLEGLTNNTTYEIQVQATPSANRQSSWSELVTVTPAACPRVETVTFGSGTFNSVVVNWTVTGTGTWDLSIQQGTTGWSTPTGETAGITGTSYTLTDLEPGKPYYVKVKPSCGDDLTWVQAGGSYTPLYTAPSNVEVKNISDVAATASWDAVADATLGYTYSIVPRGQETGIWEGAKTTNVTSVELTGLAGGSDYDFYVVTNYPGDNMSSAIKIEFSTITVAPKSISVSEITASSAKLSWENDGTATAYEYALGEDPTALVWDEVAEKTKTLEGLTANTSYTFYVRAKYSDKVKSDSVHITFRTDCNAIAELPWFEGFEDMEVGNYQSAAPACWAQLHVNDGLPYAYVNNTSYVKTGSKSMYVVSSSLKDGYLILPAFEAALNGLQISFSHKEESATKSAVLTLGYITDIANAETFVAVKEFGRATSWQEEKEISLAGIPNEVAATARLAFKLGKATDQWFTGIDDITIEEIPDCQKPVLGETTILPDGATFTWAAGGGETKFQYAVGNDPDALEWTATEATEATVHGLVPGNNYNFYVRAFCDPDVSDSVWTAFAPVCNAPTEAALTAATTTMASFSWTAAANISSYQYVVMAKGVAADWSKAKTTSNTTAEWTELAANTVYDFYVRSYYNETVQSAAASLSFRTACAAIAALPWSENFEDQTLNAAPACWALLDAQDAAASTYPYIAVRAESGYYKDAQALLFRSTTNVGYAILPEFDVDLSKAQISFTHKEESGKGTLVLGYLTDIADAESFDTIYACASSSSWTDEKAIVLSEVPAGARLAFQYNGNAAYYYDAAVDNILIEEIPACAVPTGLAASEITADAAVLTWTSEAENFKVQYTTDIENWGDEIAADEATLALSGLEANTTYYARVKAVCGEESESEYSEQISFKTLCAVEAMPFAEGFEAGVPECWVATDTWASSTDYAHSGSALRANIRNNAASLTTPSIAITEDDAELTFYLRNVYGSSSYAAGTVTITAEGEEPVEYAFINAKADNLEKQKVDLSAFYGKTVKISFSAASVGSSAYLSIDDVTVAKKQCATPTELAASAGNGHATITWKAGEDEEAWQLQYKATEDAEWTSVENLTALTYELTGLTNGTEYEVQVRAYCDETHQSAWTESFTFTPSEATGFESINGGDKAIKVMKNGVLYIIRDGVLYNAQGARVMDN